MTLDEQVRHSGEALAADLGRDLQQRIGQFIEAVLHEAAAERDALTAQAAQFAVDAEARLDAAVADAVATASADHEAALTRLREASEAEVSAAIDRTRESLASEANAAANAAASAALVAARDLAAAELAAAVARARDEAAGEASAVVARARDEVAQASAQLLADQDARQAEVERVELERQRDERDAMLGEMERLVDSVRTLDATSSLSALLDALSDVAAQEAPRTALLIVRGRELQGWRFTGFADAPGDARKLMAPLTSCIDLSRVVDSRLRVEVSHAMGAGSGADLAFLTPLAGEVGIAIPVMVGGSVGAVLYADAGGEAEKLTPASWPETLELLARHAARCLEAQTAMRAAGLAPPAAVPSTKPAAVAQAADSQDDALLLHVPSAVS